MSRPAGGSPAYYSSMKRRSFDALVGRTQGVQPWRRVFHAAAGVALAATGHWVGADSTGFRLVLAGGLVVAFAIDAIRLRFPTANAAFFAWFRVLASPREVRGVASSSWYAAGALAVALFAPAHFVAAMLVLALADPAASVVGRLWGTRPLGKGSWQGSAAFMVVAAAVLTPLVGVPTALAAAAVAAALEVLPVGIDDNLTTPLAVAVALSLGESIAA